MSTQATQYRDSRDYNEDSDSSDGTNPPTPKKISAEKNGVGSVTKHNLAGSSTSPVTSPNKNFGPSPKRTLFSRPSKMNLSSAAREIPQEREVTSPTSPNHYFGSSTESTAPTTTSSFTSLLKHAGNHVPHAHLHHSSKNQPTQSSGINFNNLTRGRSFDLLRVPNASLESSNHQPISPSFFSTNTRVPSSANVEHDDNWPLICARVLPLFNGEGLRQPIEDLNRLVSTHLSRVHDRREEIHVIEDLTELFETGIRSLDNNLASHADEKLISRLSEIWVFFFSTVLPYLEATFLPLTIEFSTNPGPYTASEQRLLTTDTEANKSPPTSSSDASPVFVLGPTISTIALKSYRDILILPLHGRLFHIFSHLPLLLGQQEIFSRLLQCISILRRVQSGDERQRDCDGLGNAVLFRRAKGRGDRRGFVGRKGGIDGDVKHAPGVYSHAARNDDEDDDIEVDENVVTERFENDNE